MRHGWRSKECMLYACQLPPDEVTGPLSLWKAGVEKGVVQALSFWQLSKY